MKDYKKDYERLNLKSVTPHTYGTMAEHMEHYPQFTVPQSNVPESKDWEVGKTYKLIIEVVQKGVHLDEKKQEVTFEIKKIKAL